MARPKVTEKSTPKAKKGKPPKAKPAAKRADNRKKKAAKKSAGARAAPAGPPEIVAVDNGRFYDTTFVVSDDDPKEQTVRIFGRNFTKFMDVRLSSGDVKWTKFRHEHRKRRRAAKVGKGIFFVAVRDTPIPRADFAAPRSASTPENPDTDGDSGDVTVTVTNDPPSGGSTTVIKKNVVNYVND